MTRASRRAAGVGLIGRTALAAGLAAGLLPASHAASGGARAAPASTAVPGPGAPIAPDRLVGLLRDYLAIDTRNPPGNELEAARFFKALFDREGIESEIFEIEPGRANLVARLPGAGTKRPLLLSNHMDVVHVETEHWSVPPFAGVLRRGYVYGRGALDMKTTGLLQAATLINIARSGVRLSRDLIFLATCDEEVGGLGIDWIVERRPDLVRDAEFMLNEGGGIDRAFGDARSYNVAVTEKSPFWIKVTAQGQPGHASRPDNARNAVRALVEALGRLAAYETPVRVTESAQAFFRARAGAAPGAHAAQYRDIRRAVEDPAFRRSVAADPALNAMLRDTIAITMLKGSLQTNVIPTVAEARVDVRLLPGTDAQWFLETIREVVAAPGITVEALAGHAPATESPVDSEIVRAIDRARARHHPRAVLAPTMLTGWTESSPMRRLGIHAYGFEPYVLDASEQARTHGNDERISVENVLRGQAIYEEIITDVAR